MSTVNENPFDQFAGETKEITVKALGGKKVTIREMNYEEAVSFSERLFSGVDTDGSAKIDTKEYIAMRVEKVALCMVEPKMTVDELNALPAKAGGAITEIADAIDELSRNDMDEKGNSKA